MAKRASKKTAVTPGGESVTKAVPTKALGVSGAVVYGGYLQDNERNPKLSGQSRYRTFSDIIANVSIVSAGIRMFLGLVGGAQWRFQPADESEEAQAYANFVDDAIRKMTTPWHRVVRRAAMFRFYGFSVQEWTARRNPDGSIGLRDIEPRPQKTIERWDIDESGTVMAAIQTSPQDHREITLPRGRLLYVLDDALNDSPEGLGLLRHLAEPARALMVYEQLEGRGFENDLRGIPVGRAPLTQLKEAVESGKITEEQRLSAIAGMVDFLQNHRKTPQLSMLLDSLTYETEDERSTPSGVKQWDVTLLQAQSVGLESLAKAIARKTRELAIIMGVESLLLGENGGGSLALSRDKTEMLTLLVDGSLLEIREAVQADIVPVIMMLNGWPEELAPVCETDRVAQRDIETVTNALEGLARAGAVMTPADPAVVEVYDQLGLTPPPQRDVDDDPLPNPKASEPGEVPDDEGEEIEGEE